MKKRRLPAVFLIGALLMNLLMPLASAASPESETGYVFRLKETAVMLLAAVEGTDPIPYADGYYTADSLEALQPYLDAGLVEFAAPDGQLELLGGGEENADPGAAQQWYLETLGMDAVKASGLDGSGVTVAVIDSGLVQGHEDLDDSKVTGYNFLGQEAERDTAAWADDTGHGSLVSGIIAAQTGNGIGVEGLADGVNLLTLRCFAASSTGSNAGSGSASTILSAIYYAIEQDVDVINMSFGGDNYETLKILEEPLQKAAEQGILLVAAVGNKGSSTLLYPAAFESVIGVGGVDQDHNLYKNSQRNDSVFVTAPGVDIYNIGYASANSYRTDTGTSMAAPMVSALAALAKQADKAIDNDGFRSLLQRSITDLGEAGYDTSFGWGSISAETFVQALTADQPITYVCGGGSLPAEGTWSDSYQIGRGEAVTLPTPLRDDYRFTGWYLEEDCSGSPISAIPAGTVSAVTLYAGWEEETEPVPEPPTVAEGQGAQSGNAAPASLDGLTAAQPYTAEVGNWFVHADSYVISTQPSQGTATLENGVLTYTPDAQTAGQTVTIGLKGSSSAGTSGEVMVTVTVADLPVSDAVLATSSGTYDLHTQIGGAAVSLRLYGNQLSGITANGIALTAGTDYTLNGETVTLVHALLARLGKGTHSLAFTFDGGRTEASRTALYQLTITNSAPVDPPNPGGGGGGGSGGGGAAVVPEPDLELLETERAAFYYTLTNGTAQITLEPEQLEALTEQPAALLDLTSLKAQAITMDGGDLAALKGGVEIRLQTGTLWLPPELCAFWKAADASSVTLSLSPDEDKKEEGTVYDFSIRVSGKAAALDHPLTVILPHNEKAAPMQVSLRLADGTTEPLAARWSLSGTVVETGASGRLVLEPIAWENPFSDVADSDWYADAVAYVCARGILEGTGSSRFAPEQTVTRGMLVTMLYRMEAVQNAASTAAFTDVEGESWYAEAVAWASENDIVTGFSDGSFGPDDPLTREQMAVLLYRYAQYRSLDVQSSHPLTGYSDAGKIQSWARDAFSWAVEAELIQGTGGTSLSPSGTATRGQIAEILVRFCQAMVNGSLK